MPIQLRLEVFLHKSCDLFSVCMGEGGADPAHLAIRHEMQHLDFVRYSLPRLVSLLDGLEVFGVVGGLAGLDVDGFKLGHVLGQHLILLDEEVGGPGVELVDGRLLLDGLGRLAGHGLVS